MKVKFLGLLCPFLILSCSIKCMEEKHYPKEDVRLAASAALREHAILGWRGILKKVRSINKNRSFFREVIRKIVLDLGRIEVISEALMQKREDRYILELIKTFPLNTQINILSHLIESFIVTHQQNEYLDKSIYEQYVLSEVLLFKKLEDIASNLENSSLREALILGIGKYKLLYSRTGGGEIEVIHKMYRWICGTPKIHPSLCITPRNLIWFICKKAGMHIPETASIIRPSIIEWDHFLMHGELREYFLAYAFAIFFVQRVDYLANKTALNKFISLVLSKTHRRLFIRVKILLRVVETIIFQENRPLMLSPRTFFLNPVSREEQAVYALYNYMALCVIYDFVSHNNQTQPCKSKKLTTYLEQSGTWRFVNVESFSALLQSRLKAFNTLAPEEKDSEICHMASMLECKE